MGGGKFLFIGLIALSLIVGAIIGIVIYNNYYEASSKIMEEYDLIFMILPSLLLFAVGYYVGSHSGGSGGMDYKPLFQGQPRQLSDGDRVLMVSLQRAGIVRERDKK